MSYKDLPLGIDISHYQAKIDWQLLKEEAKIDFVIIKVGEDIYKDEKCHAHIQGAYDVDIPALVYYWPNPNRYTDFPMNDKTKWIDPSLDPQLKNLIELIRYTKNYGIALDCEQWWEFYPQYYEYLAGKRAKADVKKIAPAWISEANKEFAKRVADTFPTKRKIIYTADSFIKEYAPNMYTWIKAYDYWGAMYPYNKDRIVCDWDTLRAKHLPAENRKLPCLYGWKFWQFSGDKFSLPGVYGATGKPSAVDLNFFNATGASYEENRKQLWDYLGFTPRGTTPPTKPEDPEVIDLTNVKAMVAKLVEDTTKLQNTLASM
jgi:GH25 family lysozyme M1 (1,4-beta-N-acetylmuramidase)